LGEVRRGTRARVETSEPPVPLFDFLRVLDLAPYEWQHALDQAKGNAMFSPDALVQLNEQELKHDDGPNECNP
jgi:hypothetical protein